MSTVKVTTISVPTGTPLSIAATSSTTEILMDKAITTITPNTTISGGVRARKGIVSTAIASCGKVPTQGNHLCNKTYVDSKIIINKGVAQVTAGDVNHRFVSTTSAFSWTYTIPTLIYSNYPTLSSVVGPPHLLIGSYYVVISSDVGKQLLAQFYSGAGGTTVLGKQLIVCGAAEANGNDGGSAHTVRLPFFLAVPEGATTVVFTNGTGGSISTEISITQVVKFPKQ